MRQRECEFVGQWRGYPANAVRKFAKVARGKLTILQEIEQKGIHVRTHRLYGV
jgi:hypothetical protein